jgi:hypothetical protein
MSESGSLFVPLVFYGQFETAAGALAHIGSSEQEIARTLQGAQDAGEAVITVRLQNPGEGQQLPFFRLQPEGNWTTLWGGDMYAAKDTAEEAWAFAATTGPERRWIVNIIAAAPKGLQ